MAQKTPLGLGPLNKEEQDLLPPRTMGDTLNQPTSPPDLRTSETTKLNPEDEREFQEWVEKNQIMDLDHPQSYYDYRGLFLLDRDAISSPELHFPDLFKQHGHPTFSEESVYSSGPGDGGTWGGPDGETFIPSQLDPTITTTETFRVGDLGPNYAGPRYNSATDQMDSPYNKGMGWFGPLINADKDHMTEYSRSGSIVAGGDRVDYPLLVPTLDEAQVRFLIDDAIRPGNDGKPIRIPEDIEIKARDWARKRINQGLSPFAQEGEGNWNQFPDIPRQPRDEIETFPDTRTFSQTP
jgi:hypothetical protein